MSRAENQPWHGHCILQQTTFCICNFVSIVLLLEALLFSLQTIYPVSFVQSSPWKL